MTKTILEPRAGSRPQDQSRTIDSGFQAQKSDVLQQQTQIKAGVGRPIRSSHWLRSAWNRKVKLPLVCLFENFVLRRQAERFYTFFGGHILFQTLRAATKLDLFSLLAAKGPLTCAEIAHELGIQNQPARVLLLGLATGGLLRKRGQKYSNTYLASQLLVRSSKQNVLSYVELQHAVMYKGVQRLYESIKEGRNAGLEEFEGDEPTLYQRLAHDPNTEEIFQLAMQELSVQANKYLADYVDFSDVKHVVDVGGGDGTNAMALVSRWPHLRVTVFDSPSVCEIANERIREAGLSQQILTQPGDCFKTAFPTDADCFLFSHFFTIWSPANDQLLLRKSFDALPSGGRVVLYNMMQNDGEDGPWAAAIGSPYFLAVATGKGMLYTWKEYEDWMQAAGFSGIKRFRLPRHHGVIFSKKP